MPSQPLSKGPCARDDTASAACGGPEERWRCFVGTCMGRLSTRSAGSEGGLGVANRVRTMDTQTDAALTMLLSALAFSIVRSSRVSDLLLMSGCRSSTYDGVSCR